MPATMYPCLAYQDADAAIARLTSLGFTELAVHRDDAGKVAHAELALDGAVVMLGDEDAGSIDLRSPRSLAGTSACVYVGVDDVDALFGRAQDAELEMVHELRETDYGSREFTCTDPEGVIWGFGTYRPVAR